MFPKININKYVCFYCVVVYLVSILICAYCATLAPYSERDVAAILHEHRTKLQSDPCKRPWRDFVLCECLHTCVFGREYNGPELTYQQLAEEKEKLNEIYRHSDESLLEIPVHDVQRLANNAILETTGVTVNVSLKAVQFALNIMKRESVVIFHSIFKDWYFSPAFWVVVVLAVILLVVLLLTICYCAIKNFVNFNRYYYQCLRLMKIRKKEESERITRVRANIKYDEFGPYLPYKHYRVYHAEGDLTPSSTTPFNVSMVKESKLALSDIEKVEAFPKFIGQFKVGKEVVGHFARVLYEGKDCLLTATHVLSTHSLSNLKIANKEFSLPFLDSWKVLAYSPENSLDYVIIEVPPANFSVLNIGLGHIEPNVPMRTGVCLYGATEDGVGLSLGNAVKADRSFKMKYGASTLPSWSGTPILNSRNRIVGVHTDGGEKFNTGTLIVNLNSKETDYFGSMFEKVEDELLEEFDEDQVYVGGKLRKLKTKARNYTLSEMMDMQRGGMSWSEVQDEIAKAYKEIENEKETLIQCPFCKLLQKRARKCSHCKLILGSQAKQIEEVTKATAPVLDVIPDIPHFQQLRQELKAMPAEAVERAVYASKEVNKPFLYQLNGSDAEGNWTPFHNGFQRMLLHMKKTDAAIEEINDNIRKYWSSIPQLDFPAKETLKGQCPQGQTCGQTASNGEKPKSSQKNQEQSATPSVGSKTVQSPKKVKRTKPLETNIQKDAVMPGQQGPVKPKNKASGTKPTGL